MRLLRSYTGTGGLRRRPEGFTLVEVLLSTTILVVLMLACTTALDYTRRTWAFSKSKVEQFREARIAFETVSRHLSQATLNTYWDYYYKDTGSNESPQDVAIPPSAYVRHSELQFQSGPGVDLVGPYASATRNPGHAVFFQAPLGLSIENPGLGNLLNARGYYVQFSSDESDRPPFLVEQGAHVRHRYRLMEYRPPAERTTAGAVPYQGNTVYVKSADWFRQDLSTASRVVADNILLMIISPRASKDTAAEEGKDAWWIAPRYDFNSLDRDNRTPAVEGVRLRENGQVDQGTQHLLPPLIQLTMVAVDEPSAQRWMESRSNQPVDLLVEARSAFTDPSKGEEDMGKLKAHLTSLKLNYRVFTTTVALRNARWDGRRS